MQTITCVIRDNASGYHDPLIYTVDVFDPKNEDEVLSAVKSERLLDIGGTPGLDDDDDLDLDLLFAFPGNVIPIADWRE